MKVTTYSAMRGLSIIAIITFLFSYGLEAQEKVVIKERVEIAPKALRPGNSIKTIYLAYRIYTLQYPAEVSSIAYVYWDHITISQVNGDTVYHGFWPFTCNGIIMKFCSSMYYDDYESDEHPMYETGSGSASYGIFNAGTDLTFDLIYPEAHPLYVGEELNEEYPGTCGGYFRLYRDFDHDGSYGGTTYSIDIVRKDLTPPFTISFNDEHLGEITSVMYGEEVEIGIWLKDVCRRYYSVIPIPVSYRVMIISGSEWGYLYNQRTGQTGDTIDVSADDSWTTFKFLAIKQKPTQDQQVVLQAWSDHTSAPDTLKITVKSSSCMSISISKPMIHPSERDTITLMQNTPEGIMPYPAYQMFDIWTNVDEKYGRLRCIATGDLGTNIWGTQPFEFIAADNIDVDSIVVAIQASVSTGGGGVSSIGIGTKDTLRLSGSVMANKQSVVRNISALPNEMNRKNIELSIQMMQSLLDKGSAKKGDEKQRLVNGIKKLKTQLASTAVVNPTKKQSSLVNIKQTSLSFLGETGCTGIDSIKIMKIELVVTPPKDTIQKIAGTNPPTMPKPMIKAQLKNYHNDQDGTVNFHWTIKIKWTNGRGGWVTPSDPDEFYEGDTTGSNSQVVELNDRLDRYDMRGGEQVTLTVTATTKADGKVYAMNPADIKNPFQIKGLNPDQTVVRTEISAVAPTLVWNYVQSDIRMLYIITYQESKYNQFAPNANIMNRKDPFYPLQGLDNNDFGIMQINLPTDDGLIWNWKENVAAGMGVHSDKKQKVARYIDDIKNATCGYYAKYKTKAGRDTLIWTASNQPGVQADWYGTPDQPLGYNPTAMSETQRITETFQRYNGGAYYRWEPDNPIKDPSGSGNWIESPTKNNGVYAKDCMKWYNGKCPWE